MENKKKRKISLTWSKLFNLTQKQMLMHQGRKRGNSELQKSLQKRGNSERLKTNAEFWARQCPYLNSLSLLRIKIARLAPKLLPACFYYILLPHQRSTGFVLEPLSIVCWQFVGSWGTGIKKKQWAISIAFQQKNGTLLFASPFKANLQGHHEVDIWTWAEAD